MWNHHYSGKVSFILLLWIVGASFCMGQGIQQNPFMNTSPAIQWIEDEIIVKFKPGCPSAEIERIHAEMGGTPVAVGQDKNVRLVKTPPGIALDKMIQAYSKNPHVQYAEKNFIAYAHMTPNDPYFEPLQWNFFDIDMESAWDIQTGNTGVIIAVLDTGVAYENFSEGRGRYKAYALAPDLAGTTFVAGYDFINNDTHPNDDNSHGTHVTGTIAQTTNNEIGVAGIAFNCAIMPVKVLDSNGSGSYLAIANGIRWAADHEAQVINMSLGGPSDSDTLASAIDYAYNQGVTIVASTGNDGGAIGYPAAYDNVIAVGATHSGALYADYTDDPLAGLASYSNYGAAIDLVAPGGDEFNRNGDAYMDGVLQNTFNPNTKNPSDFGFWFFTGTSMAAPHVSGLAALLIANGLTNQDLVRQAMEETAVDLGDAGWDQYYGWGLINAYAALQWTPSEPPPPVADFSATPITGNAPLMVQFTDLSTGYIGTRAWDFGDEGSSTDKNPSHVYTSAGIYTVSLTVTGEGGSDIETKTGYITVEEGTTPPSDIPIRVVALDLTTTERTAGRNYFVKANASITVAKEDTTDGNWDVPVSGVTVEGHWTDATNDADYGVTSSDGLVLFSSDEVKTKGGITFVFTIDNVTGDGYIWDSDNSIKTKDILY